MTLASFVICGATESMCECVRESGHEGPHECDEGCGGSWSFDADGKFVIVRLPLGSGGGRPRRTSGAVQLVVPPRTSPRPIACPRGGVRFVWPGTPVMADEPKPPPDVTWYVLFCRVCDPELEFPHPFTSAETRGRWAAEHKRGTGHDFWLVVEHPDASTDLS